MQYFRSAEVQRTYGVGVPWISVVIVIFLCLTIVGIPAAIGIVIGRWIRYARASRVYQQAFRQAAIAEPIMTYALMADSMLRQVRNYTAPGLVIGTFRRDLSHQYFVDLAKLLYEISTSSPTTDDERFVVQLFRDEYYHRDRRRLLPMGLTGGVEVYAFDLMINNSNLPRQIFESVLLPCMATPGPSGIICMIPWAMTGNPHDWLLMMGISDGEPDVSGSRET